MSNPMSLLGSLPHSMKLYLARSLSHLMLLISLCSVVALILPEIRTEKPQQGLTALRSMMMSSRPAPKNVGVVLLAGGKGTSHEGSYAKAVLTSPRKACLSSQLGRVPRNEVDRISIVIVLDESFRDEYQHIIDADRRIRWADPGKERQDSVFNGLSRVPDSCSVVAIHDAARPLVSEDEVTRCLQDGIKHGAAVLGVPMKATVKESLDGEFVTRTVPRATLWEVHTPQVGSKSLFLRGFKRSRTKILR